MIVDYRRFSYALEPLRRQRQWQLDALITRLGRVQREISEAEDRLETLRKQLDAQNRESAQLRHRTLDPASCTMRLRWLVHLRSRIRAQMDHIDQLKAERSKASAQCLEQQKKVDVLDAHRQECVRDFVCEEGARLTREADRDWLIIRRKKRGPSLNAALGGVL